MGGAIIRSGRLLEEYQSLLEVEKLTRILVRNKNKIKFN